MLANFYPAPLSNSKNEFALPARLLQNQYVLDFQKDSSMPVYSGLLIYDFF